MAEYDLISKIALLRHLDMAIDCKDCPRNTNRKTYYERCACSEVADICNTITDFATFADVQPVKHGRWEQIGKQSAKCTACGGVLKSNGIDKTGKALIFNAVYHYCPYCGTRMDGDKNG